MLEYNGQKSSLGGNNMVGVLELLGQYKFTI